MLDSFRKLDPRVQWRNPVMFVVYVGSILTTVLWVQALGGKGEAPAWFILNVAIWLWFTVLFANFAEALAEGRSKAQAAALRGLKQDVMAKKLADAADRTRQSRVRGDLLRKGDVVLVEAGDFIPGDGEVIDGVASVDESAITGESAPVIRESGGDFSAVTGGTRVLSDWLIVRITANPGETFIDRMIAMVESAKRQKTPNEIALDHPAGRADDRLPARDGDAAAVLALQRRRSAKLGTPITITVLVALLVCLIPTTIGGIAVGDRHRRHEPHDAGERHRDVRPRGRGRGRRRRAAARQDRHHHARQPAGVDVHPGRRRHARRSWPTPRSSAPSPTRRPKGAASSCSRSSASACASAI